MAYVTVADVVPVVLIVCTGIVLVPLAVNPLTPAVAVAVHVKVAPARFDVSVTNVLFPPEQMVCVNGEFVTVGEGFTVIVKLLGVPGQVMTGEPPVFTGVTVIVAVTGVDPLL